MMSQQQVEAHYTNRKTCCDASKLEVSSNLRCPCCGYLATTLNPVMLEDLHRTKPLRFAATFQKPSNIPLTSDE